MRRIWTNNLRAHIGKRVRICGWLHHYRRLARLSFLVIRDARGLAQVVIDNHDQEQLLFQLHHESVLQVDGLVVDELQAPGGVEIHDAQVSVIVAASEAPVIDLYRPVIRAQLPTLLDNAAVTLRHPQRRAAFEISAVSMAGFRSILRRRHFIEIQTPKIVAAATEGGANVFSIDYFGRRAFLAQSPQFYKQTMVGVFERVFEVGPVFRAEPHDTQRHVNEYVSLDAEMGFIEDHTSIMDTLVEVVHGMLDTIASEASTALELLGVTLPAVPDEIPRIHFSEAQELVSRDTGEDLTGHDDLNPSQETWLGEWAKRQHGSDFVFITGFPLSKRPFYTHPEPERPTYSNSFDLLFKGLELVTGGQRLHRYDDYIAALTSRQLELGPFEGYLQAFRHGMPPHGGFAIGLERWVSRIVGSSNIRDTTLFPRDINRLTP